MIAGRRVEDLGLVLEASKRLAVHDAVAIALKGGADRVLDLLSQPAARVAAVGRLGRQQLAFALFEMFADQHVAQDPAEA
jgi:hypothetical protein